MDYQINPNQVNDLSQPNPEPTPPEDAFTPRPIKPINTFPSQPAQEAPAPSSLPVEPEPQPSYSPPTPPPMPDLVKPIPDFAKLEDDFQEKPRKKASLTGLIVAVLAIIIIIALAFLFYYFTVSNALFPENNNPAVSGGNTQSEQQTEPEAEVPAVVPTEVIAFAVPQTLPQEQKSGNCWTGSLAQPYRNDAYRCSVGTTVYDPCFKTSQANLLYCKMNPITGPDFLIRTSKALPAITLPQPLQDNWAWFLELKDGTELSPYTGKRPSIDGEPAFYGSKVINGERMVIIGGLEKGQVWTGKRKILIKEGSAWVTKSSDTVEIKRIWQ